MDEGKLWCSQRYIHPPLSRTWSDSEDASSISKLTRWWQHHLLEFQRASGHQPDLIQLLLERSTGTRGQGHFSLVTVGYHVGPKWRWKRTPNDLMELTERLLNVKKFQVWLDLCVYRRKGGRCCFQSDLLQSGVEERERTVHCSMGSWEEKGRWGGATLEKLRKLE